MRNLSYFLYKRAYKLTNIPLLYILILKKCKAFWKQYNHVMKTLSLIYNIANRLQAFNPQANQSVQPTWRIRLFLIFVCPFWRSFFGFGFQSMKMSWTTVSTLKWTLCLHFLWWKKLCPYLARLRLYANAMWWYRQ